MIISLAGDPGSGKTTVARLLAERLGMHWYSIGDLRAKMAKERGMTINELNELGERDPSTDTSVDDYQRALGEKEDDFVIEGRLSWHFIPHSFKVYLSCDPEEAAKRIFRARKSGNGDRDDEPLYDSVEEARLEVEKRVASDRLRYAKHYGLSPGDPKNFDLAVDTTHFSGAEETVKKILEAVEKKYGKDASRTA